MLQINFEDKKALSQALLLGGGSAFLSLLGASIFAPLLILLAFLAYGDNCGIVASTGTAVVLAMGSLFFSHSTEVFFNLLVAVIPAIGVGYLAVQNITKDNKVWWYPESLLLQKAVLLSLVLVLFMSLTLFTKENLNAALKELLDFLESNKNNDVKALMLRQRITPLIQYSLGGWALVTMLITSVSLGLANVIAKKMKKNIRPGFEFKKLEVNPLLTIAPLVLLVLIQIFDSFICSGLFVASLFSPIMAGLSAVHRLLAGPNENKMLAVFYCSISVVIIPALVIIVFLGIVDSFHRIEKSSAVN